MTTPNYDDILNALDRQARQNECSWTADEKRMQQLQDDARLLREAMDIVRERRDQGDELARLREGLVKLDRYYEAWPDRAPFISAAAVEALLGDGDGDGHNRLDRLGRARSDEAHRRTS